MGDGGGIETAFGPTQEIDRVGVIIAGNDLERLARLDRRPGALDQQIHGAAGMVMGGILAPVLVAPAGIDQMRVFSLFFKKM